MKTIITSVAAILFFGTICAQETEKGEAPDTTRFSIGRSKVIVVTPPEDELEAPEPGDTIDAAPDDPDAFEKEAHFAGLEFGPTILMNSAMQTNFPNDPQWENDPGKSFTWNLNIAEHKFAIYKNYVGITTGVGFNFTQIGLRQYILNTNNDSLWATVDTVNQFDKNKLRGVYLQVPLMVEFCSQGDGDEGFYLSAGLIGGVRIASSVKHVIDTDKRDVKEKIKGTYGLSAFRMDAAVKLGYNDWGLFANYNLVPLFDTDKTAAVYPFTFGATLNF